MNFGTYVCIVLVQRRRKKEEENKIENSRKKPVCPVRSFTQAWGMPVPACKRIACACVSSENNFSLHHSIKQTDRIRSCFGSCSVWNSFTGNARFCFAREIQWREIQINVSLGEFWLKDNSIVAGRAAERKHRLIDQNSCWQCVYLLCGLQSVDACFKIHSEVCFISSAEGLWVKVLPGVKRRGAALSLSLTELLLFTILSASASSICHSCL